MLLKEPKSRFTFEYFGNRSWKFLGVWYHSKRDFTSILLIYILWIL